VVGVSPHHLEAEKISISSSRQKTQGLRPGEIEIDTASSNIATARSDHELRIRCQPRSSTLIVRRRTKSPHRGTRRDRPSSAEQQRREREVKTQTALKVVVVISRLSRLESRGGIRRRLHKRKAEKAVEERVISPSIRSERQGASSHAEGEEAGRHEESGKDAQER